MLQATLRFWGPKLFGGLVTWAAIATPHTVQAASFSPADLDESWSFAFEDYAIEHQGQSQIDITVSYDYVDGIGTDDPFEYPEFLQIYNFIDDFLVSYPNETDFWEILNKNLVTDLLNEPIPTVFGFDYQLSDVLDSLTVDLAVASGSSDIFVPRTSTVTGTPGTEVDLDESWSFAFEDYAIEHQGQSEIDLTVSYDYVDGIGEDDPFEYPEFLQIFNYVDDFLTDYPNETDFWEILNKNLVTELLSEPIPTVFGFDYELAEVLDELTINIDVQPGSSNIDVPRSSTVTGTPGDEIALDESWVFAFEDYDIEHQGQSVIDLMVGYDYVDGIGEDDPFEYPEFLQIFNFIETFLTQYPNETDFWEILNKNLVTDLLSEPIPTVFGFDYQLAEVLDTLTVDIDVQAGSSNLDVPRSSTVTGTPGSTIALDESWVFAFEDYAIEHQGQSVIDLLVSYDYVDGIGVDDPFEYPEFLQIYNFINAFLIDYPNETDFWEILNKNLVTDLLSEPIPTVFGFDYQLAEVLDELTVDMDVQSGSSDIFVPRSSLVTGTVVAVADVPEPRLWLGLGLIAVLVGSSRYRQRYSSTLGANNSSPS
ncbi:MAG: hypothetical protein AAGF01_30665 [Cyanobacteria bacterium P01_G01_bin.38]